MGTVLAGSDRMKKHAPGSDRMEKHDATSTSLTISKEAKSPYILCQGDCKKDSECDLGLSCFITRFESTIPGCSGTTQPGKGYCYKPHRDTLVKVFSDAENGSLGPCQGHCSHDDQCKSNLKCLQRTNDLPVPGCNGKGISNTNYCYEPVSGHHEE